MLIGGEIVCIRKVCSMVGLPENKKLTWCHLSFLFPQAADFNRVALRQTPPGGL